MKNLSRINKIIYFLNIVLTILTFVAYILPFLTPKYFPILSVLTLILPLFLVLNSLFFCYWFVRFKKQMILSGLVLLIGITFINKFYKFSNKELPESLNDFSIMSYNVRLFNLFHWIDHSHVPDNIRGFVNDKNPDILCIQEYSETANVNLRIYKHKYILLLGKKIKTAQAIFSKFPIVNSGNIEFENSNNNAVFVDLKKGKDTIRIYNIHLESLKISPDVTELNEGKNDLNKSKSKQLFNRISKAFTAQQKQAEKISEHRKNCTYPTLICGDMNNSAFSYVYRNIRGDLKDCFEEAGSKFGETYNFKFYPARIDYIFVSNDFIIKSFENCPSFVNSDHFPIIARLELNN